MKIGRHVNIGGFQGMDFESNERSTPQECARDLIAAMTPLAATLPTIKGTIEEIKKAYNV